MGSLLMLLAIYGGASLGAAGAAAVGFGVMQEMTFALWFPTLFGALVGGIIVLHEVRRC